MDLEQETKKVRKRVGEDCGLGGRIKFDLGSDGIILIDALEIPNKVCNDDGEADCTISISSDDFLQIQSGDLDPTTAFMMGKLKIEGSMGLAMKLQGVLG